MKLPNGLPDELLISRLIRYVTISGENGGHFVNSVFGSRKVSIHPFLTARLDQLAKWSEESAEVIFFEQTLASLFIFFLPNYADRLKQSMLLGGSAQAHRASQLSSFGGGSSICLKSCPVCTQQDLYHFGVSYWHRAHQIPGVVACAYHPIRLQQVELLTRQRVMPCLLPSLKDHHHVAEHTEFQVARFCAKLLQLVDKNPPFVDVASLYRSRLSMLGLITEHQRVRRQALMKNFWDDIKVYRPDFAGLFPRHASDYRYLSQLLEPNASHHPFRHLLFSWWLFREPQIMFSNQLICANTLKSKSLKQVELGDAIEQKCLNLLKQHHSLNQINQKTGKSRCYLKRLASLHSIPLKLHPKKMSEECKRKIIRLAYSGLHRNAIAEQCGIGIGSVEQIISGQQGLVEHRRQLNWESKRRRCRIEIIEYLRLHPESIRRDCKASCNAAYFWLYSNDPIWLASVLPKPVKPVGRYIFCK